MEPDVLSFEKVKINNDLLDEIWSFDPRTLDSVPGGKLSTYAMALAQYLVYFTYQKNLARAEMHKISKFIERTISITLTSDKEMMKQYKTKAAAADYVIMNDEVLMKNQTRLDELTLEMVMLEGIDKSISELIATIKRELTRRENELYAVRQERK